MNKNGYGPYSLGIFGLMLLSTITLASAEVTTIQPNSKLFYQEDEIIFSGTVEKGSTGLVTIVICDFNDKFVLLAQATINPDNSFKKMVKIDDRFIDSGIYDATEFIFNMTQGSATNFEVSFDEIQHDLNIEKNENKVIVESPILDENMDVKTNVKSDPSPSQIASFADSDKHPQYYLDRYYNEPSYKSWFDRNYPGLEIEVVGYFPNVDEIEISVTETAVQELIDQEFIPEAHASLIVVPSKQPNNNSEIAQVSLAIAALGILFGAVYGIKRKVDDNFKQISINRDTITKKLIHPFIGLNPKTILQTRLAKGEITLEEYEKLQLKLS